MQDSDLPKDFVDLLNNPEWVRETVHFIEALKRLRVHIVGAQPIPLSWSRGTTDCFLDLRALSPSSAPVISPIPTSTTAGQILISTGVGGAWFPT